MEGAIMRSHRQSRQWIGSCQHHRTPSKKSAGFCRSFLVLLLLATLASASPTPVWAADGALDPSFNPGAGVKQIPLTQDRINYSDGTNRYLVYGFFTSMTGQPCNSLARFSSTGVLDTTFNPPINGEVRSVVLYKDSSDPNYGKILVAGRFSAGTGGGTYYNLARFTSSGTLDTSFSQTFDSQGLANTIAVQSDGKLLIGGWSLTVLGDITATYHLLRLNANGSVDGSYPQRSAPEGLVNSVQILNNDVSNPNRALVFGTLPNTSGSHTGYIVTFLNNGAVQSYKGDETFNGPVYSYRTDSLNRVVYVGQFTQALGVNRKYIARFNSSGTLDSSFDPGAGPNGRISHLFIQADDKIVVAGNFNRFAGNPVGYIARLDSNGAVDSTFTAAADDRIFNFGLVGGVGPEFVVFGSFRTFNGTARPGLAYLDSNYNLLSLYSGWTSANTKNGYVYAVATQADGKVLVGGDFSEVQGKYCHGLARLNPDGSLDNLFRAGVDGSIRTIALQADGKMLLGGYFGECNGHARTSLARVNPTASIDLTFNPIVTKLDGSVSDLRRLVYLTSGQIMVAGHFRKINATDRTQVARLNANGTLDEAFNSQITINLGASIRVNSVAPTTGSTYVVSGYVTYDGLARGFLCRLLNTGALDTSFGPTVASTPSPNVVITAGEVMDMGLQPDGRIVIVGNFSELIDGSFWDRPQRGRIARFTAEGALDNTFTTNIGANNTVNCLALQPNGKFIIGGYFTRYNLPVISDPNNVNRIARVNSNGSFDATFKSLPGADNTLWAVTLLPGAKKAYIGGQFTTYDGVSRQGIARIFTGASDITPIFSLLLLN
jgi:uncharacterized delta-60 repeat protein